MSPAFPIHENGKTKKYTSQNMEWGGAVFFLLSPFWSGNKGGPNKKSRIRKKRGEGKAKVVVVFCFFRKSKHVFLFLSPPPKNLSCTSHICQQEYTLPKRGENVYESHFCIGGKEGGKPHSGWKALPINLCFSRLYIAMENKRYLKKNPKKPVHFST